MLKVDSIQLHGNSYNCSKVNLIIGTNNSGKSTFLRNLYRGLIDQQTPETEPRINITISINNARKLISEIFPDLSTISSFKEIPNLGFKTTKIQNIQNIPWNDQMLDILKKDTDAEKQRFIGPGPNGQNQYFQFFINMLTVMEDSASRLQGQYRTHIDNLNSISQDPVGHLYRDKSILALVNKNIFNTFGINVGFDNLVQGNKPLRILPSNYTKLRPDTVAAAQWWEDNSLLIESQGDGIRAYLKVILSLLQPYKQVIFIDEPETFLHPPQRRALGTTIADLVKKGDKQIFIATHDPDILRGILNSKLTDIRMFRLMRKNNIFSSKIIEPEEINKVIKNSSNLLAEKLLSSFFYQKVILTESENDRVFYENSSALYFWQLFQNSNFIGFNGTKKAVEIFKYLHSLKLDVRLVVDIDFILDNTLPTTITDTVISSEYIAVRTSLCSISTTEFRKNFKKTGVKYFKHNDPTMYIRLTRLIEELKKENVFIVPVGEMESWTSIMKNDLSSALNIVENKRLMKLRSFLKSLLI